MVKVICKYNDPEEVPYGISGNFDFGLQIGKEYTVMGMVQANKQLWYLLDENSRPSFFPFQLFEVANSSLSCNWHFKIYDKDDGLFPFEKEMLWGYYELCFDIDHYEKLLDRDSDALKIYFQRKSETCSM